MQGRQGMLTSQGSGGTSVYEHLAVLHWSCRAKVKAWLQMNTQISMYVGEVYAPARASTSNSACICVHFLVQTSVCGYVHTIRAS